MLIGQDRAGKTSLKKSLKGICFDPQEYSSVGIEVDPSHCKVSTETWKTGVTANQYDDTETAISFDYQTARSIACSLKEKGQSIELESGNWEGSDTLNSEDFKEVEDSKPVEPLQDSEDKTPRLSSSSIGSQSVTSLALLFFNYCLIGIHACVTSLLVYCGGILYWL